MREKIRAKLFDEMMASVIFKLSDADDLIKFMEELGTDKNLYRRFASDALNACSACQRQGYRAGLQNRCCAV